MRKSIKNLNDFKTWSQEGSKKKENSQAFFWLRNECSFKQVDAARESKITWPVPQKTVFEKVNETPNHKM